MREGKRLMILATAAIGSTLISGCVGGSYGDRGYSDRGRGRDDYRGYDYNRPDPRYGDYDAGRYHRAERRERRLSYNDRVYRGRDGRYYCRHEDGTTGLIVGGLAGGVLGNVIAPGGSETLGTILGAGAGALIGRQVDKDGAKCR